jgi:hypothetical protein
MKKFLLGFLSLLLSISGAVAQAPSLLPTYWSSVFNLAVPAAATDIVCLENPNGVAVRLLSVGLYGLGSASGVVQVSVLRRTSLDSGGTSTTSSVIGSDPRAAGSQVTFRSWTVKPTALGTLDNVFGNLRWDITTNGNNANPSGGSILNVGNVSPMGVIPTIRAANSAFCINFNAPTPSSTITVNLTWTESAN